MTLNRVFSDVQPRSDFSVATAFSDQSYHLDFSLSETVVTRLGVGAHSRAEISQELVDVGFLATFDPIVAVKHRPNREFQLREAFLAQDASSTELQCLHDLLRPDRRAEV